MHGLFRKISPLGFYDFPDTSTQILLFFFFLFFFFFFFGGGGGGGGAGGEWFTQNYILARASTDGLVWLGFHDKLL